MPKKSNKKKKSEKINKTHLFLGIGLFLIFSLAIIFFNFGPTDSGITGNPVFVWGDDGAGDSSTTDSLNMAITKYIFFGILIMLIYWALDFLSPKKYGFGKFLISAGVSYIAISFIAKEEITSIISTYTALGATFTAILPFIIVLLFTSRLIADGERITASKVILERFIWIIYGVFVIYYILHTLGEASKTMSIIMLILAILALIFGVFFEKTFMKFVMSSWETAKRMQRKQDKHAVIDTVVQGELQKGAEYARKQGKISEDFGHEIKKNK